MCKKIYVLQVFFILMVVSALGQTVVPKTENIESILYLGEGQNQPLVVGLGGAEGGNAWASDRWKPTRDKFIEQGYAFLALAYFGKDGTPKQLDRISIEAVHNAIVMAATDPKINKEKIAIVGGSRGADLALLLGSYYSDIKCIVGIVPSHAVFPGHTNEFNTSSWTFDGKELPFVPVSEEAVPALIQHDLRKAFETMLKDKAAEEKAIILVEKIKAPILLISATKDEVAPTTPMAEKIMARLKEKKFTYHYEHVAIDGGHAEPLKHFDLVFTFLKKYFPTKQ